MDDTEIEQKLTEYLTPVEVSVPVKLELDNSQLDTKIMILKEQQDQIMHILKINYWTQLGKLVQGEHEHGLTFLLNIQNNIDSNLFHHLSKIYSLRKMSAEYDYVRRNNLEYAAVV